MGSGAVVKDAKKTRTTAPGAGTWESPAGGARGSSRDAETELGARRSERRARGPLNPDSLASRRLSALSTAYARLYTAESCTQSVASPLPFRIANNMLISYIDTKALRSRMLYRPYGFTRYFILLSRLFSLQYTVLSRGYAESYSRVGPAL